MFSAASESKRSQPVRINAMTDDDNRIYQVVVNDEEQYSIWFIDRQPPAGWTEVGKEGPKEECLAYIEEVWTDMRPQEPQEADGRTRVMS